MADFGAGQKKELSKFDQRQQDIRDEMHDIMDKREEKFHERLGRCYIEIEKFSK